MRRALRVTLGRLSVREFRSGRKLDKPIKYTVMCKRHIESKPVERQGQLDTSALVSIEKRLTTLERDYNNLHMRVMDIRSDPNIVKKNSKEYYDIDNASSFVNGLLNTYSILIMVILVFLLYGFLADKYQEWKDKDIKK